jgi:hypothetical protein
MFPGYRIVACNVSGNRLELVIRLSCKITGVECAGWKQRFFDRIAHDSAVGPAPKSGWSMTRNWVPGKVEKFAGLAFSQGEKMR